MNVNIVINGITDEKMFEVMARELGQSIKSGVFRSAASKNVRLHALVMCRYRTCTRLKLNYENEILYATSISLISILTT